MIDQSPTLTLLIKQLQRLPYVASKNIYRVAEYFLKLDHEGVMLFCKALEDLKTQLSRCQICWIWKEKDRSCYYCTGPKRDPQIICVVESWHDVMAIEKTGGYMGVYHLLGGIICPLDGIGPDDLTIKQLLIRLEQNPCKELIFAFNQTPEGEATSAYIASKLKEKKIQLSCLARGLPVGSSLEAMDRLTLSKALSERRPF
jgi:recombination protein RecR